MCTQTLSSNYLANEFPSILKRIFPLPVESFYLERHSACYNNHKSRYGGKSYVTARYSFNDE